MSLDGQLERLCALYDEKSDDELLGMYADRDDLTEVAQEALAQTMRARHLEGRTGTAVEVAEADSEALDSEVGGGESAVWTFADAFEAREAIRVLNEAGIWQRVVDRTQPADALRGRVQMELMLIVRTEDLDAAVRLLREKIGLFPKPEAGDGLASPLSGMQEMVLLAMFERHEGLVAAEALGKAGISYCWRDGADESQELPDEQTVAIEVRGEQMEVATGVVEKALAASDAESLQG
jgi:hypothetical protein